MRGSGDKLRPTSLLGLIPQDAWEGEVIRASQGDSEHWTQHQGGALGSGPSPTPQARKGDERRNAQLPPRTAEQSWAPDTKGETVSPWTDSQGEWPLTFSQPSFCKTCPCRLIKKESHTLSFIWKDSNNNLCTPSPHVMEGKRYREMSWRREAIENKVFLLLPVYSSHIYGPPTMCQALGQVAKTLYWSQTHLVCALLQLMIQGGKH